MIQIKPRMFLNLPQAYKNTAPDFPESAQNSVFSCVQTVKVQDYFK